MYRAATLAGMAALALATSVVAGDGRADAAVTGQVMTFNMAGKARNDGSVAVADDTVASIRSRRPLVVTLQEVCRFQLEHMKSRLGSGYGSAHFVVPGPKCAGNSQYGNAVLWRRDALAVNHTKQYDLESQDGLEQRQMGCVKSDRPRLVACTVHLSTREHPASQSGEMTVVARTANGWATRYPTIVGGDFNETPDSDLMDPMYLPDYGSGANGGFREIDDLVDRDGEATHPVRLAFDEKLDYIFFTRSLRWGGGDATDSRRSDHRVLVGSLTIP